MRPSRQNSAKLYASHLGLRRLSIVLWAHKNRFSVSTVYAAIDGTRKGPKSLSIINKLNKFLGIK